jgi:ketosteroid isomerase-like protein
MMQTAFQSAEAAETAFYEAFEHNDADAMMNVWCTDEDIECIHPLGDRLMGVTAVTDSWQSILSGSRQLRFRIKHARRFHTDRIAIHVVYEHIAIDGRQQPPVIATNVYRFNGSSWHMVLHHASPATDIGKENETEEKTAGGAVLH